MMQHQMVRSGVPQGYVLEPALFLFYISDIVENISSCVRLFADDITMYSALSCSDDVFRFQRDIEALACWSKKWRMTFNVSKCSVIFVGKSRNVQLEEISYKLNNEINPTTGLLDL